jgi:hypothetical protein
VKLFNVSSLNFLPVNDEFQRKHLLNLATGQEHVRDGWFAPLKRGNVPVPHDGGVPDDEVVDVLVNYVSETMLIGDHEQPG